jgi:hypothetical protein
MASNNSRISLDLPAADVQDIQAALKVLQDKLLPHLIDLGPEARRELPKMGDKTVAFVGKALDYARANPQLRPAYLDLTEFEKDWTAVELLASVQRPLSQVMDIVDDSLLLAGSEAYGAALLYYQSVKSAARAQVPAAATIAEDLAQRFPGRSARQNAPEAAQG